jgi:GxxExxY protein
MSENEISRIIVGKAIKIHKILGPGLLESAYKHCLFYELTSEGLYVQKEKSLPIKYCDLQIDHGYRIDLLVENKVVIELKTVEAINEVHEAQLLTYLKFGGYKLGLILNFKVMLMKHGIRRFVNGL